MMSYPSTILGRERAIVVKLEHIKAIITANEVLVLKSIDPNVELFLRELQLRLASDSKTASETVKETDQMDMRGINTQSNSSSSSLNNVGLQQSTFPYGNVITPDVKDDSPPRSTTSETSKVVSPKTLPFEFRALEICLECACRCLEEETSTLVQEAHPALDELTSKISTLNLERVRQIKSRLVTISGRVQKVRDELEQLLDDDMDMAEMYLTCKLDQQELADREDRDGNDQSETNSYYECDQISLYKTKGSTSEAGGIVSLDTVELEMLLEAYFVQIEGTLNKLSALREYVDDTEDYINIMLDDKQNQLLQMGVILSTATLLSSAGIAVVGMFGMNIHIGLYDAAPIRFWQTSIATVVTCTILFITSITWGRWKGLLSL